MKKRNLLHLIALTAIALSAAMNPGTAEADTVIYVAGSSNQFGKLDLTKDVYTNIGTLTLPSSTVNIFGMGFGADGKLYGLDSQQPGAHLWQINTTTAVTTDLGSVGQSAIDATADASGKMYALSQDTNAVFYTLNPPTTSPTVVGSSGITGTGLLAVNASGTQIFTGALDPVTGTTDLYSVNPTTGVATLVGDTGFFIINGLFVNGTLYGFDDNTNAIVTINTTTGAGTQVGTYNIGSTNGVPDAILASAPFQAAAVPEPSSVVLGLIAVVACGSLGLLRRRPATPVV
jgi:hypothetical protein